MKLEEYNNVVTSIKKFRGLSKDCAKMLIEKYPNFTPLTLYAILSQEIQYKMKISHTKIFKSGKNYYSAYKHSLKEGQPVGILVRMAEKLNTSPALLAKKVLEEYYETEDNNCSRIAVSRCMRDTTLITDQNLSYEVYLCVLNDDQYGPISNAISESVGAEYELKLEEYLKERNIPYLNENHLRSKGYDKTPDCKLALPIAVNGFIVNWIESKAQFGSLENHKRYRKEQFLSYWNRFGPGLVIYWFGFIVDLDKKSETRFMIMDHFPENITYMDPSSIK